MLCENCGNQINDTDNFCSKCGYKIIPSSDLQEVEPKPAETSAKKIATTENKKSALYILWYSLVGLMILGSFSSIIIPELAGKNADEKSFMALAGWIGVAFAIRAKQKGKSGWLWFFIGFIGVGSILTLVISFLLAFVKS